MGLLQLQGLSKSFGGLVAVNNLSFSVEDGELVGIIGPNGAGKSTLFNLITGFYRPTKGKIIFGGEDITGFKPNMIARRGIIRTFQLRNILLKEGTVLENLLVAHHVFSRAGFLRQLLDTPVAKKEREWIERKSIEILDSFGLGNLKNELPENLPYGYQRNMAICIAMAAQPKVLLLDEVATGLSREEVSIAMDLIKKANESGTTVLVVEHDMAVIMTLCRNRIIVLNYGTKIAEGTSEEIQKNNEVIEAYLGVEQEG
jgi:branched-chain amino acid transport system ATP-binding protein